MLQTQTHQRKPPDYHTHNHIRITNSSGSDSGLREGGDTTTSCQQIHTQHSQPSTPNSWCTTSSLTSSDSSGVSDDVNKITVPNKHHHHTILRSYSPDTETDKNSTTQTESIISQRIAHTVRQFTPKTLRSKISRWGKNKKNNSEGQTQQQQGYLTTSSQSSSMTSVTACEYPDKEYVELVLPIARFGCLGITIIGQTTPDGHDVGIYCGGIQPNSAASQYSSAIEPGDRIISIDGEDLRCLSNDAAVETLQMRISLCLQPVSTLRKVSIKLGLVKYIDRDSDLETQNDEPLEEPQAQYSKEPIISEWVKNHEDYHNLRHHSDSSSSIISSTEPENSIHDRYHHQQQQLLPPLSIQTSMIKMIKVMANNKSSGLKIRDREWLGLIIPLAFLGADLVDWLHDHVEGLDDRRDAKHYASTLFKGALIKPTIQANPRKFSEKSYYKF